MNSEGVSGNYLDTYLYCDLAPYENNFSSIKTRQLQLLEYMKNSVNS